MTTLLVDADGVAFASAAGAQQTIRWDEDTITVDVNLDEAREAFVSTIDKYASRVRAHNVILCYSCPTRRYFRHDILPTYKGNRKSTPPVALRELREWTEKKYDNKHKPGLEADDVIGILATHPDLLPGAVVIVSADKDLLQIPGDHMNARDPDTLIEVSPEEAERFLWKQVLMGDAVDNYTGIPGIGPVKADRILDGANGDYLAAVYGAYCKYFDDDPLAASRDLERQFNVARILTSDCYDFKRKEPILWQM